MLVDRVIGRRPPRGRTTPPTPGISDISLLARPLGQWPEAARRHCIEREPMAPDTRNVLSELAPQSSGGNAGSAIMGRFRPRSADGGIGGIPPIRSTPTGIRTQDLVLIRHETRYKLAALTAELWGQCLGSHALTWGSDRRRGGRHPEGYPRAAPSPDRCHGEFCTPSLNQACGRCAMRAAWEDTHDRTAQHLGDP